MTGRLLYVDAKWPTPSLDSASQRTIQLISALVGLGFAVDLGAMFPLETSDQDRASIELGGARGLAATGPEELAEHVARHALDYDVAVLSWTRVAERLIGTLRATNPAIRIVFDTVDVNHVREYRHARASGNANILRRALATKRAEVAAMRSADLTLAVTEQDAAVLRTASPESRVDVVTLAARQRPDDVPGPEGRGGLLFLGHYYAWHNVDAVQHMAADVMPHLRAAGSGARLTLAGSGRHALIDDLASADVEVLGFVEDLAPLFDRHRAFVCPLRIGSGIKGKLLSALALGLPIVATPIAVEGMNLRDGAECLIAESAADFAAACVALSEDDDLWRRLSDRGLDVVRRCFSEDVVRQQVRSVFEPLLGRAMAAPEPSADARIASR